MTPTPRDGSRGPSVPPPGSAKRPRLDPDDHDAVALAEGEWSRERSLRDGTPILLRAIRPSDRARLAHGLARLSPASRYLRFHAPVERLSETQLDVLTEVDHHDHEAVVALDLDRLDRPGVGVARFIREPYEPEVAEAAVTVADEYHGLGAGTILLGALAARARAEGVRSFRSYVLDGNQGMLDVFDHLGARRERETDGLWRVDLEVPADDDEDIPTTPAGRAFLELAREDRRLASILPPIWSRLRRSHAGETTEAVTGPPEPDGDDAAEELEELRRELDDWLQHRRER